MARVNKIYAGPVTEPTPQVQERLCATAVLPGTALIESGADFAQAGANAAGKIYVAQDNYLMMKGVDDAYAAGDRVIGMEALDEQFFNLRIATGNNILRGSPITTVAGGKFGLAGAGTRILFYAEEAFNNNTGADQLVRARAAKGGGVAA